MTHFFGYIGHVQNIPWNQSGRYIVALQTDFHDRMPGPDDPANVVLIDTKNDYRVKVIEQSRGWNPQQGTMFYWNPAKPETSFSSTTATAKPARFFVCCTTSSRPGAFVSTGLTTRRSAMVVWPRTGAGSSG